jgi:hypothetical protein
LLEPANIAVGAYKYRCSKKLQISLLELAANIVFEASKNCFWSLQISLLKPANIVVRATSKYRCWS